VATIFECAVDEEKALKLRIKIDGKTYEAEVEILDHQESAPDYPPYPPIQQTFGPAPPPEPLRSSQPDTDGKENGCRSPVAGMVVEVKVETGQTLEANAVVIVLESMKMEMQITAPHGGVVKNVLVVPGAAVKANQLMVEFE